MNSVGFWTLFCPGSWDRTGIYHGSGAARTNRLDTSSNRGGSFTLGPNSHVSASARIPSSGNSSKSPRRHEVWCADELPEAEGGSYDDLTQSIRARREREAAAEEEVTRRLAPAVLVTLLFLAAVILTLTFWALAA
jgi:hypothetical protein